MNTAIQKSFGVLALSVLLLAGGSAVGVDSAAPPHNFVVGISPFLERSVKDDVYRRLIAFVVEEAPAGSSIRLFDGYNLHSIAEIEVPNTVPYRSAKTRAIQFKSEILKLKQFLVGEQLKGSQNPFGSNNLISLPQFMEFLSETLPRSNAPPVVVLIGSPLYLDAKEPEFSMSDGYFPSDGHLKTGRDKSVYGIADRADSLQGFQVHLCYFGDPWVSDLHRERVTRFWKLFVEGQSGTLVSFSGDLSSTFKNAILPVTQQPRVMPSASIETAETKIEMLRVTREVASADWLVGDAVSGADRRPSVTSGPMKIGIRWHGHLDLDLYASARPGAETLFFQHTRCPEGYYYKDHRSAPDKEYEFIEFTAPVNVEEVEAMVNFYKGNSRGGALGEVRIEFDHRIYTGTFRIAADTGNRGRFDSSQMDYWTRLDIPRILHLGGLAKADPPR